MAVTIGIKADPLTLIEDEGTETTITFSVDGEIPDDGVIITLNNEIPFALGDFGVFLASFTGGQIAGVNADNSGLNFRIRENTATIILPVFNDDDLPPNDPNANRNSDIGVEETTFFLVESEAYNIDPNASEITLKIADTASQLAGSIVAFNDNYFTVNDRQFTVFSPGVLNNDTSNLDFSQLTVNLVHEPPNGSIILNTDGSFNYTPNLGFSGIDRFTYQVTDSTETSNLATVNLIVEERVNTSPVAENNNYTTAFETVLTVNPVEGVLSNDQDADGDILTAILLAEPTNGSLILNFDGSFNYTPDFGFSGIDSFSYQANDGIDNSNPATVNLVVEAAPSIEDDDTGNIPDDSGEVTDEDLGEITDDSGEVTDEDLGEIPDDSGEVTDEGLEEITDDSEEVTDEDLEEIPDDSEEVTDEDLGEIPDDSGEVTDENLGEIPDDSGEVTDEDLEESPDNSDEQPDEDLGEIPDDSEEVPDDDEPDEDLGEIPDEDLGEVPDDSEEIPDDSDEQPDEDLGEIPDDSGEIPDDSDDEPDEDLGEIPDDSEEVTDEDLGEIPDDSGEIPGDSDEQPDEDLEEVPDDSEEIPDDDEADEDSGEIPDDDEPDEDLGEIPDDSEEVTDDDLDDESSNQSPVLTTPIPDQTASQRIGFTLNLNQNFWDPEEEQLTYSVTGLPANLQFDADTGLIFGVPLQPGQFNITVIARDPQGNETQDSFELGISPFIIPQIPPISEPVFLQPEPTPEPTPSPDPIIPIEIDIPTLELNTAINSEIFGDLEDNELIGTEDNDAIYGGQGNDTILGLEGDDNLFGEPGDDLIIGGPGNDVILGDSGNDTLFGDDASSGNSQRRDFIFGGDGDDLIFGNQDNDTLLGGEGNDTIYGGKGDDLIIGGEGDNLLSGDTGNDTLIGGSGRNRFMLSTAPGIDTIVGFKEGIDSFELVGDLTFNQLRTTQENGLTQIRLSETGEIIAVLDVEADQLDFLPLEVENDDSSDPEMDNNQTDNNQPEPDNQNNNQPPQDNPDNGNQPNIPEPEEQLIQVRFSTNPDTLIKTEGTVLNFEFSLNQAPPEDGLRVFVDSSLPQSLTKFDLTRLTYTGGESFPTGDFDFTGFAFTINEPTASISIPVFDDSFLSPEPTNGGLVSVTYQLLTRNAIDPRDLAEVEASQRISDYLIDPLFNSSTVIFADNPESLL